MKCNPEIQYYFFSSYHRKILDDFLIAHKDCYKGVVLDIGGRDHGKFKKPKNDVERWIFADIEEKYNPDIVLNVENMSEIEDESIDVINATSLFEHVEHIEQALGECYRILKESGVLITSTPFLFPIHADPCDFQRWTQFKWEKALSIAGFGIDTLKPMGGFFTVLMEMHRVLISQLPFGIRGLFRLTCPVMDLITKFDNFQFVKKNKKFNNYTTGYLIIAKKVANLNP